MRQSLLGCLPELANQVKRSEPASPTGASSTADDSRSCRPPAAPPTAPPAEVAPAAIADGPPPQPAGPPEPDSEALRRELDALLDEAARCVDEAAQPRLQVCAPAYLLVMLHCSMLTRPLGS